jgi:hypothetical protein
MEMSLEDAAGLPSRPEGPKGVRAGRHDRSVAVHKEGARLVAVHKAGAACQRAPNTRQTRAVNFRQGVVEEPPSHR